MFTIPYIETREEFFYLDVFLKLLLGLLAIALVINKSGKGNLAPTSAMDQVQNYVLGGIIGGVIYSPAITLFQFAIVLVIWAFLIIGLRKLKTKILAFRYFIDGTAVIVINRGKIEIEDIKMAYSLLEKNGTVERSLINQYVKRCSSGIILLLSQVPFIGVKNNPTQLYIKANLYQNEL